MSALRIAVKGEPVRLIVDPDPFLGLTPRQRFVLETVRQFGGNRARAARHLGINVSSVQLSLRLAARAGAPLPPIARRGPDLGPRVRRWKVRAP